MKTELSTFAAYLRERILFEDRTAQSSGSQIVNRKSQISDDAVFNMLALELFRLQARHNPAYRMFCDSRSRLPAQITHWADIPAVPTAAFKELELTSLPEGDRSFVFHSSGTTEQRPSRHFHSVESLALYEDSAWVWFRRQLMLDLRFTIYDHRHLMSGPRLRVGGLRLLSLTPPPDAVRHSSLVHMFEVVRRNCGAANDQFFGELAADGSWTLDFARIITALKHSQSTGKPLVLLGTAFSFVHLVDCLAERNLSFTLPAGSRVMETGGYKGRSRALPKAELHTLISERLGVPASRILCEYGMSELSSQAYERKVSGFEFPVSSSSTDEAAGNEKPETRNFIFPPWVRAQIISPETGGEVAEGETGLLRVFDLANVFSVLAVQTEDLAVRRGEGFELVGRAIAAEPRGCSLMAR